MLTIKFWEVRYIANSKSVNEKNAYITGLTLLMLNAPLHSERLHYVVYCNRELCFLFPKYREICVKSGGLPVIMCRFIVVFIF